MLSRGCESLSSTIRAGSQERHCWVWAVVCVWQGGGTCALQGDQHIPAPFLDATSLLPPPPQLYQPEMSPDTARCARAERPLLFIHSEQVICKSAEHEPNSQSLQSWMKIQCKFQNCKSEAKASRLHEPGGTDGLLEQGVAAGA